jgi:GNAT superfamily N-acetyltransferase
MPAYESEIQIEKVDAENLDGFFEHLKSTGVKIDAVVQPGVSHYYTSAEFENYFALLDGQLAASASIFLCEGIAWLSNATTLEPYRNRGCQSALLRRRIERAEQLACDTVFTDAVYGSTSHRNILRAGFELAYSSVNMQLAHQP